MNCRAFTAPVGFERRGYPRGEGFERRGYPRGPGFGEKVDPHRRGQALGEGYEVQVAVVGQVPGPEAGLSDVVPGGGGFTQELGAVGVAFYEVPGGVVAGNPGEELADIHGLFLLVKLAGEIGDGVDGGPWLSVPAVCRASWEGRRFFPRAPAGRGLARAWRVANLGAGQERPPAGQGRGL